MKEMGNLQRSKQPDNNSANVTYRETVSRLLSMGAF